MNRMMRDRSHNTVTPSSSVRPANYCNTAQVYALVRTRLHNAMGGSISALAVTEKLSEQRLSIFP
jgi:hypothetical protein